MTQAFVQPEMPVAEVRLRSVPKQFVDPPAAWNPTVGLFLGGYALAALTIWGWFSAGWPLPVMLVTGFLALHDPAVASRWDPNGIMNPGKIIPQS